MEKEKGDYAFLREDLCGTTAETTFAGALSFMRRLYTRDLEDVDLVVTGVPLDSATTNRPGARFGPRAIRAASSMLAWERPYGMEFDPFDVLAVIDYGDCNFDSGRPETIPDSIEEHARSIIEQGPGLLSLGGDHFISYPLLRAHAEKFGAPLSILHFDAHSDTWEDEEGRVDHGTMFYHAVQEGLIDPDHSVQIGVRTRNADTLGFHVLDGPWVQDNGIDDVIDAARAVIGDRLVYLTFDIDCLDPAYAPGTGTPVCGGLTTYQAQSILRGLHGVSLIGGDVTEVAPAYDIGEITALAAATIAMEIVGIYAARDSA